MIPRSSSAASELVRVQLPIVLHLAGQLLDLLLQPADATLGGDAWGASGLVHRSLGSDFAPHVKGEIAPRRVTTPRSSSARHAPSIGTELAEEAPGLGSWKSARWSRLYRMQ